MRSRCHVRWRGAFTLIELLIVVAIIAILAAIAVPNFLEAQARAKVSREQADMRSIATALESYRVDCRWYPVDWVQKAGGFPPMGPVPNYFESAVNLVPLTTPVAFITAIPGCAFQPFMTAFTSPGLTVFNDNDYRSVFYEGPWAIHSYHEALPPGSLPYDLTGHEWVLSSPGPDRLFGMGNGQGGEIYDPTNGTISSGNIYRLGP